MLCNAECIVLTFALCSCIQTIQGHKSTVTKVLWNGNGNWFLTSSRDQLIKLWDIRTMRQIQSFKGHSKEVTGLCPILTVICHL